ncbi:MAG: tetratricopeptide repeat protein [Verrucomicrobiota bacterium]
MGRFGQLEFDAPRDGGVPRPAGAGEADRCLGQAWASFERGEFEPALRWFSRVLEHDPHRGAAWTGQVRALIEMGQYPEAGVWADQALDRFPDAAELLAAKAVSLGRQGRSREAMPLADAAVERPGESAYVWLARGDVLLAAGMRQVDPCFDRARQAEPGSWQVRWLGGRIRAAWGQYAAALQLAREAAALAPDRAVVWLLAGDCQSSLGLAEPAARSFHQALTLVPDCRPAEAGLARLRSDDWMDRLAARWRAWRTG